MNHLRSPMDPIRVTREKAFQRSIDKAGYGSKPGSITRAHTSISLENWRKTLRSSNEPLQIRPVIRYGKECAFEIYRNKVSIGIGKVPKITVSGRCFGN